MRIARFTAPSGQRLFGVVEGRPEAPTVAALTEFPWVSASFTGERWALDDVRLLAPIFPPKIVGIGKNYAEHAAEMGGPPPAAPLMFLKPNTAVIGPDDAIRLPADSRQVEHEGELAVVIGPLPARELPRERALEAVFGYTIANDVTARDLQKADGQWTRAKGFDSFCPLGPWIETVLDPADLAVRTEVDGEVRQDSRTSLLLHDVATLISYVSHVMTLLPNDVVLTGTPAGVGPLKAGQTVSVTVEGIGTLTNPVRGAAVTEPVRARFAPSPTGDLHVGNVRSALFNWAFARHHGGVFVLRIEDTDAARSTEASYRGVVEQLRWLGLDWDEGPEVGGPHPPYLQSQRLDSYRDAVARLLDAGYAYESYSTEPEWTARRAERGDKTQGYDNHDRELTAAQVEAYRAEGRRPVVRFRMPDEPVVFEDLVRGEVRFEPENVPDYVLTRADGSPLYPLTNPVDDAVMGITHVLRGDDLLPSTPRQIPLHAALRELGIASGPMPRFGHLPMVLGEGRQRLSKRKTPEASLITMRAAGYLPEGILNYLALLGWSLGGDRELFTLDEMVAAFGVDKISRNPATFDVKKLTAVNGVKIRELEPAEFARRLLPFLVRAGLLPSPVRDDQLELVSAAAPLVQERAGTLVEAAQLLGFLLVPDHHFELDPAAAAKVLVPAAEPVLDAAVSVLEGLSSWTTEDIQEALQAALVETLGLKPRVAYGPVRVAVTGRTVSPPLFESLELLGPERTLARLRAARAGLGSAPAMG